MTPSTLSSKKSINISDTLYARVSFMGQQLFNIQLNEMQSMSQIVTLVRERLSGVTGLVKISLRNASQGWTTDHWCAA